MGATSWIKENKTYYMGKVANTMLSSKQQTQRTPNLKLLFFLTPKKSGVLAWCSALHQSQFGNGKQGTAEGGLNRRRWTVAFAFRIPFKQNKDNTGQNPSIHLSL